MGKDKQDQKPYEDPTAHAEQEINRYFYDENQEKDGHPTDYMNSEMPAVNIAKPDDEK
ncbi:hypothetical protein [Fictibacillus barbaricus]|uniref:DUF4025 domain-containing protein n=1 Tax=Fictibacillus barbaricus TaxID=182136 RepID=A0ABS2Z9E7_9BACL|nr:hypothetical protein [Fictibacillus barbaricus]MBN3544242.1 hypothetical protein [Fictibacillus barbaricus]GGB68329.1 hypothetical protein GCM10007199_38180 [Fictibacillus barbaricus]